MSAELTDLLAFDSIEDLMEAHRYNPGLLEMAKEAVAAYEAEKQALVPPGAGAPPPDPAAAAMPPGGAPGMPPAAGGAPGMPVDPTMAAGAAPGMAPGMAPGVQAGAMPPHAGGKGGKQQTEAKIDKLIAEVYQLRHLLVSVMKAMNIPIPDEAILGPEPPTPQMDPAAMAASPAVAGAGAMAAAGAAPAGPAGPAPGGPVPMGAGPAPDAAKAAESLLRLLGADDDEDDATPVKEAEDAFWGRMLKAAGSASDLSDEAVESIGVAVPHTVVGPVRTQPSLLAWTARRAAEIARR